MSQTTTYSPLKLESRSLAYKVLAVVLGTIVLTLSSRVEVPMFPVPMTMQTLAVTLVGALYGWRMGGITILAWLLEGAVGLPVFAGGGGILYMVGPTGGYLAAFLAAGITTGYLAEKGWNGDRPVMAFASLLIGNAICLAFGAAWLTTFVGGEQALIAGVYPFVLGAVLKSALGAAILSGTTKLTAKQ